MSPANDCDVITVPRLVIGAPHGRSGKTTATLALASALSTRGIAVQPFKKGPDYIDPSWLSAAARAPARNLDTFMLPGDIVQRSVARAACAADLVLVEGNHGLYDSLDDEGGGSTAALARLLCSPILLVVDATRMGRSVAALVEGYQYFEADTNVAGVILNNVAGERHAEKLRRAIEGHCGLPVVGILPHDDTLAISDRHLGLIPRDEYNPRVREPLDALCRAAQEHYDLDMILEIAHSAPPLPVPGEREAPVAATQCRVGVVRDACFTFYYPENLEALQDAGAELVFIDALYDYKLPAIDALYIGGGFPEVFASQLQANVSLRCDIRSAVENDLPVYAECGGLMYLARSLAWQEKRWEMIGALPCDVELVDRPQGHGYVLAWVTPGNPFFSPDTLLRGHEHHHSRVVNLDPRVALTYRLARGRGLGNGCDGIVHHRILAAYTHLHALGTPRWAAGFIESIANRQPPTDKDNYDSAV